MEDRVYNPITEGPIGREMLVFFFPILFGSLFQQIYNAADAMIVGRFLGKVALSSVGGSSGQIVMMVVGFFVGLSSGATVLVSQFYGAGDGQRVRKSVHTVVTFSIISGVVIMVAGIALAPAMLGWMKAPAETVELSILYLRVYFLGMVGNLIYNVGSGILRAVGDSKRPFIFLLVSCLLNVALDLLFVIPLGMGVFGVALATIISQAISAILVIIVMIRQEDSYRLIPAELGMDYAVLKKMIRVGLPAGLQSVMYGLSNIIIQIGVNGLGTDHVAAWATYYKIDGVFWMTMSAYGIVAATFVGQNYGAGLKKRVKRSVLISLGQAFAAAALISVLIYLISPWFFPLFTKDPTVKAIGIDMMRYLTRFYILYVCIEVLTGAMRGVGDTLKPMIIAAVGVCVIRSLWIIFVMPLRNNMYTMMFSYPLSWGLTSLAFAIYMMKFSPLGRIMKE